MRVCVFCSSSEAIEAGYIELAAQVGTALAGAGHTLVSGGGRVSMMGAVARAARAGGVHTTGVIPRRLMPLEVADTEADDLLVVDTMRERKREMDERSDAFLALPGGIGTFEELFEAWTARTLGMHDKPVVVLDLKGFYAPLWQYLDALREQGFMRTAAFDSLARVETVDAALAALRGS